MGRKLYVGNLPFDTGEDELKLAFAQCGTVSEAKVVTDRETGRSRGFGFVTMSSDQEAQGAIARWNGNVLGGRSLNVNEAVDKPRGDRGPSHGAPRGQQQNTGGYSRGTYVGDAPPQRDDGGRRGGGGRGRDRGGRGRDRDYG